MSTITINSISGKLHHVRAKSIDDALAKIRKAHPVADGIVVGDVDDVVGGGQEITVYSHYDSPSMKNFEREIAVISIGED